jgi:hypothetical protein
MSGEQDIPKTGNLLSTPSKHTENSQNSSGSDSPTQGNPFAFSNTALRRMQQASMNFC